MYETDVGTGEARGKKIRRKAGKCVKKLLPNAEIKNFFIHSMKIHGIDIYVCFVFVAKTVLIAHVCFGYCFIPWNASLAISNRLGPGLRSGADRVKTSDPYHRVSHSAINAQGDEEEGVNVCGFISLCKQPLRVLRP